MTDHSSSHRHRDRDVAEALQVRATALHALATGRRPAADVWDRAAAASAEAWRLCLTVERCAILLAQVVPYDALPRPAADVLRARAELEMQRAMSAHLQLGRLAALAREAGDEAGHATGPGCAALLLKGGAHLAAEQLIDLDDVDLLLPPGRVHDYGTRLETTGYQHVSGSGHHSLGAHLIDQAVPIEVHFAVPYTGLSTDEVFAAARPIAPLPGLGRLAPAHQLWHLLVETVVSHGLRRGRLRDLVLLGAAARDCTPADRAQVCARIAAAAAAVPMRASYAMALAIAEGRTPDDAFRDVAAANYLLASARLPRRLWKWAEGGVPTLVLAGLGGDGRRHLLDAVTAPVGAPSRRSWLGRLDRVIPFAARPRRIVTRCVRLAALAPFVWPIVRRARTVSIT